MSNRKLYASSGLFVLITIIKLLLPEATAQARNELVALINMDMNYRSIAIQVGSLLTDEAVQEVLGTVRRELQQVFDADDTAPSSTIAPPESEDPIGQTEPTLSPNPSPTEAAPTPTPAVPNTVLAAMEAFKTAQAAYSDYELPETVSYENLVLPFSYISPVSGVTSSGFGYRVHPIENVVKFHYGTDFIAAAGTPIAAFADGQVTMTGYESGYGNFVEITHADGWKSLYAHCSEVKVNWWQDVKKGEIIALAGDTGEATGPHLHLELTYNGLYTNPEFFF